MEVRWTCPVKLLLVNHEYPPIGAGAATASQAIAKNLSTLGHEVAVLTARHGPLPAGSREGEILVHRVKCVRKHPDRSNLFEMVSFLIIALLYLPFVLAKRRPDALIIFFSLPSGPIGLVANLLFRLPYLVSLRGGDVPGLVPQLDGVHRWIAPIRRWLLKRAKAVVANSEGLRRLSEGVDPIPVRLIPNGVDTEFFRPDSSGSTFSQSGGPLRILFVGRLQEQKNLAFLLKQLARLPSGSFELHIVGDGPQKECLRDVAGKIGIAERIKWYGWLPRAALPKVYQSADCLMNPSLYEGMPNVVLEAMASGLPVIASKVPGNDALVVDNKTGFLFDLQQPAFLLKAIERLIDDRALASKLGSKGRDRVMAEFSWRNAAQAYVNIFTEAAANSCSTSPGVGQRCD